MAHKKVDLKSLSRLIRQDLITLAHNAHIGHVGSAYSITDILVCLYFQIMNIDPKNPDLTERDRFILSKGHAASALFTVLHHRGFFDRAFLDRYCQNGSPLMVHPEHNDVPGIEVGTGSLGHGLPIGVGMAYAAKKLAQPQQIFTLISDAENNEGTTWEAALFAGHQKLNNLTVIIDYNGTQALGKVKDILDLEPLEAKWRSFHFEAIVVDGHNHQQLLQAFNKPSTKPKVVIAKTVMGKGVSFMEGDFRWHYYDPKSHHLHQALAELTRPPAH